jgi:hypothetical protein
LQINEWDADKRGCGRFSRTKTIHISVYPPHP